MPVLQFLSQYYDDTDRQRINELLDQLNKIDLELSSIHSADILGEISDNLKRLKESGLEIGETKAERRQRLDQMRQKFIETAEKEQGLYRQIKSIKYEFDSIRLIAYSRYTKAKKDSEILQDCLDIINKFELNEVNSPDEIKPFDYQFFVDDEDEFDLFVDEKEKAMKTPSPIVQFSFTIGQKAVNWFLDYFRETKNTRSFFEIMKAIYDRTLVFFPDGFTDQDKESEFFIFDDQFFKTLDAWNQKQADKKASQEYELSILANYRPEINRHILPSNTKISSTMFALGTIGTEPHQMSIEEYLQSNKVNDVVTFKGLADDGLQFVFNENIATKDTVLVSFKNLENARGGGTAPSVVFAMVLEKMTSLGYFVAPKIDTAVTISVKELIESGDYANWRSAKRALEQALKTCDELLVNFSNKKTGMDVNVSWFSSIGWKDKGTLSLRPNPDINWRLVGKHFAIYPIYLYKLKTHAYKLAYYIFTQARINKPLNKDGDIVFNLKLTTICHELGLPSVETVSKSRYKQLILDKIITAMKEIEDTDKEYYQDRRLVFLKLDHTRNLSPREIIETSNLVVTIKKGDITETYQAIRDKKVDIIESKRRKAEKKRRETKDQT